MGPSKTRYESAAYFPSSTVARPDFAEVVPRYHDRLEKTYLEDIEAMERQQRGLRSAGNMRGRFSYRENPGPRHRQLVARSDGRVKRCGARFVRQLGHE